MGIGALVTDTVMFCMILGVKLEWSLFTISRLIVWLPGAMPVKGMGLLFIQRAVYAPSRNTCMRPRFGLLV